MSSNINEVIRAVLFFLHHKILQAQNHLQQTKIKNTHKKHLREKTLLARLFAFYAFILLVLLVENKYFTQSQKTSFHVTKTIHFLPLPTKLDFIFMSP